MITLSGPNINCKASLGTPNVNSISKANQKDVPRRVGRGQSVSVIAGSNLGGQTSTITNTDFTL